MTRHLTNYFGIDTKGGHPNNRFSANEKKGKGLPQPRKPSIKNTIQDFFINNVIAWFVHDWRIKPPYDYPPKITEKSSYSLRNAQGGEDITIAIAADWGTDTPQSQYIGDKIRAKNADYTVHLGDTYYSGNQKELANNYGTGGGDWGLWPRGQVGSFALAGNHEMFSSGRAYIEMVTDQTRGFGEGNPLTQQYSGQEAPCFCLRTKHWCILGLDTGYHSLRRCLHIDPDNTDLKFPDPMMDWLKSTVRLPDEKRGIVVLTHHQYSTAFHKENEFSNPAAQLEALLPGREIIWIWGHEHRFAMYGKYKKSPGHITAYGRCIGNGGMPDEHRPAKRYVETDKAKDRKLVLYDGRTAATIILSADDNEDRWQEDIGYNGYALLGIDGPTLQLTYYASYGTDAGNPAFRDDPIIKEEWMADFVTGQIRCMQITDLTSADASKSQISYFDKSNPDPGNAGR